MKIKLLITTLALIGISSGLYPAEVLEWKMLAPIKLDRTYAKKFAIGGTLATGVAGATATWLAKKYTNIYISSFIGVMATTATANAAYYLYARSLNYINNVEKSTNNQIQSYHNTWVKRVNDHAENNNFNQPIGTYKKNDFYACQLLKSYGINKQPGKTIYVEMDHETEMDSYSYEYCAKLRDKRINNLWSRLLLGPKNIRTLKSLENYLSVVIKATENLPDPENKSIDIYIDKQTNKFTTYAHTPIKGALKY